MSRTIKRSRSEKFLDDLYRENLRAFHELESMRYGIMARLGLDEADALELAVAIVAVDRQASQAPRATVEVGIGEVMTAAGGRVSAG